MCLYWLPKKQKPQVCLLMRQTNERPRDKLLRVLRPSLQLLACLGTTGHLLLPPLSCLPLMTPHPLPAVSLWLHQPVSVYTQNHKVLWETRSYVRTWGDTGRWDLMERHKEIRAHEAMCRDAISLGRHGGTSFCGELWGDEDSQRDEVLWGDKFLLGRWGLVGGHELISWRDKRR